MGWKEWKLSRGLARGLWAVAFLLVACASPRTPAPSLAPSAEAAEVELKGATTALREPTATPTAVPAPPTSTPEGPPPGMALFQGTSTYDRTRRFELLYATGTWRREGERLRHQAVPGCTLDPQAGGMGLGPDWTRATDRVTLGGRDFERRAFTRDGQTVPAIVSYGLGLDESYFLFQVDARDLAPAAFERCRADAEAVLATFTPLER
jgi:hypothetical protein